MFLFFLNDYKLLKNVKVSHWKFVISGLIFFCSSKIQMIINRINIKSHLIDYIPYKIHKYVSFKICIEKFIEILIPNYFY